MPPAFVVVRVMTTWPPMPTSWSASADGITPPGALVESRYAPSSDWMTSAECSSELRSAISAAAANRRTTTRAYPASAVHATRLKRRVSTWLRRRSLTGVRLEPIPDAADRSDRCRAAAEAQFLAQIVDVHVHDVRFGIELVIPHRFGDARPRYRAPGVTHQKLQERELARREIYDTIVLRDPARQRIERDASDFERGVFVSQLGTADEGMHARQQLGQIEGLRDIIIGAAFEPAHARLELIFRREQQHRRRDAAFAQLGDDAEAVAPRQHHIQDETAETAFERAFQCPVAGVRFGHAVAFLAEGLAQEAAEIAIVLNEKYLHAANVRRACAARQCEHDEKALRNVSGTSLGTGVPTHSAHEHRTSVGAQPDCSRGHRHVRRRLLLDDGARLRRCAGRDLSDLRIYGRQHQRPDIHAGGGREYGPPRIGPGDLRSSQGQLRDAALDLLAQHRPV